MLFTTLQRIGSYPRPCNVPIKSIINEIEENKLEETDKIEEQEEKAQKLSKADEEAIKHLLNESKNSENNQLKDEK